MARKDKSFCQLCLQPRCHRAGKPSIHTNCKSCIYPTIAHATPMQHVVTLWVGVQVSHQFLHVKHISLLWKRLITMYVLVEENENREFHWWKIWPRKFTCVPDHAHCVTKITHTWNAVHFFVFFCMIIEIEHLLSWKVILLSSVIVAKERVPHPLIRREAGIPR